MNQQDSRRKGASRSYYAQEGARKSTSNTGRRSFGTSYNQTGRPRSTYQPRTSKRRRRPQYDITKILLAIILAIIAVIAVAAAMKFMGGKAAGESNDETETTTVEEIKLKKEVTVDGIPITDLSKEEARASILKEYEWGMKVTYKDQEYDVKNLLEEKVDALLTEIYAGEPKESYFLDTANVEEAAKAEAAKVASLWDEPAKNGSISGFDKASGQFTYAGEKKGFTIDQESLAADIAKAVKDKKFTAVISVSGREVEPEISEAKAKEMYQVIGTYTTTTTTNKDRNKNIELASDALNGVILQPGEEFSFNAATGERSEAKGYRPAGAYVNGVLVEEPGGGVCQVSSTLYNAVVFSGLTTTERHAHSYEPSYVTPGEDAMVSYGGPDMKFVNNSNTAVAIRTNFADRKLKVSIVGIPILEKGVTLSMTSKKTAELDAPAPVYEEDQTLQPGEEKIVKAETKGSRWVTNLVTKKDGVEVSNEFFHNSTYRGKPATIKRNTSGVVIPASSETAAGESSEASSEGVDVLPPDESSAQNPSQPTSGSAVSPSENGPSQTQPSENEVGPGADTKPAGQPTKAEPETTKPAGPGNQDFSQPGSDGNIVPPNPG